MGANILGVGTAVPPFRMEQSEVKAYIEALFSKDVHRLERLLPVFDNSSIKTRYFAQPPAWYASTHSFAEANRLYEQIALELAGQAARQAINKANVAAEDIGAIIFVSSTGIATPTIDTKLITRLALSNHIIRIPIWGLGCAGGAAGIARAAELAQAMPEKAVLFIAVELCSLTFQRQDFSKSNLVGTGIFADGAAAAVLAVRGNGPTVLGSLSTLFPNSENVMGWDIVDSGLKVRFSRDIPAIVRRYLPELMERACNQWQIQQCDIEHYVVHPGGPKVIEAYVDSLRLNQGQVAAAYEVLEQYGNMSSASILFVLAKYVESTPASNHYGVMLALGPGFCAEQVLFKW